MTMRTTMPTPTLRAVQDNTPHQARATMQDTTTRPQPYTTRTSKFTRFETVYVIMLNIRKRLPKQRCSTHFARPEEKKYYIHFLALALTLTFNHLANEPVQPTTMLFSLMYLTCGSATEHKCLIRCATDYWGERSKPHTCR